MKAKFLYKKFYSWQKSMLPSLILQKFFNTRNNNLRGKLGMLVRPARGKFFLDKFQILLKN